MTICQKLRIPLKATMELWVCNIVLMPSLIASWTTTAGADPPGPETECFLAGAQVHCIVWYAPRRISYTHRLFTLLWTLHWCFLVSITSKGNSAMISFILFFPLLYIFLIIIYCIWFLAHLIDCSSWARNQTIFLSSLPEYMLNKYF